MQITIPSWKVGGTLSQLAKQYNTTVAELMRLNPQIKDPDKIQEGALLNVPELAGTLKTGEIGGGTPTTPTGKTLPETPTDNLVLFRNLLRTVSERAGQEAITTGVAGMGFEPSAVSGGTLAGIVDFIKKQKTTGIADIYKSTIDLLDTQKKQTENQLQTLISTGAIANLDDTSLNKIASITDWDLNLLQEIRNTAKTKAEAKTTDAGRITQLNQFLKGKIEDNGKVLAQSYMAAYKEWIGLDGTISDFKYAYPVEEWVGEEEWENLPVGWRPSTKITDVKSLPSEQQVFINQVQAKINSKELKYDDAVSKYPEIAVYLKIPSETGGLFRFVPE